MKDEGLFYFYNVLSKTLATFGRESIPVKGQAPVLWRDALVKKLISLQKVDSKTGNGYWVNPNNRFWEANDVLVTSYTLIAMDVALGKYSIGWRPSTMWPSATSARPRTARTGPPCPALNCASRTRAETVWL